MTTSYLLLQLARKTPSMRPPPPYWRLCPRKVGGGRSSRMFCGVAKVRKGISLAAVSDSRCLCIAESTNRSFWGEVEPILWMLCGPCVFFPQPSPAQPRTPRKQPRKPKVSKDLSSWSLVIYSTLCFLEDLIGISDRLRGFSWLNHGNTKSFFKTEVSLLRLSLREIMGHYQDDSYNRSSLISSMRSSFLVQFRIHCCITYLKPYIFYCREKAVGDKTNERSID